MEIVLAVEVATGPLEIQSLIRRMANENPSWGEERIANELLLKLRIRVCPQTVSKYLPKLPMRRPRGDMRWSTFLRLHAQGIIACDFLVAVTATLRLLYVFVVIEHRSRRLIRVAQWIGMPARYVAMVSGHSTRVGTTTQLLRSGTVAAAAI